MAGTSPEAASVPARASGIFAIGGELTVHRLGFGAMRLPAAWSETESPGASREMLREAVRLGVDFIDTARATAAPRRSSRRRSTRTPAVW
jgi:diketogulonate reductase-like aldo/keto reductase